MERERGMLRMLTGRTEIYATLCKFTLSIRDLDLYREHRVVKIAEYHYIES